MSASPAGKGRLMSSSRRALACSANLSSEIAWDKANGSHSPTDAALFTSTNWDKYSTSIKDLAGVILKSH